MPVTLVLARVLDTSSDGECRIKYSQPLDTALREIDCGYVAGASSSLDGNGNIACFDIDVILDNEDAALVFTKKMLRELGAPQGSVIYCRKEFLAEPVWDENICHK